MLASLPMYDLPEIRAATDAWWQGLARAFRRQGLADVPAGLTRDRPRAQVWRAPELLFSQTCGYPLTHAMVGILSPIATPCYAAPGCTGAAYRSLIVVRADDPADALADLDGRVAAVNGAESHSGWNALRAMVAPAVEGGPWLAGVVVTGSHEASLAAVKGRQADLAAIDCVSHALLARHRPQATEGLRVLTRSAPAPGLPYVTTAACPADRLARLRASLIEALTDPELESCREALLLTGAEVLPQTAYRSIAALVPGRGPSG